MPKQHGQDLIDEYVERILQTDDLDERERLFCDCAGALGFPKILYAVTDMAIARQIPREVQIVGNFENEWIERYLASGYVHDDPVAQMNFLSNQVVTWEPFLKKLDYAGLMSPRAQRICDEARSFNAYGGVSIPIHTFDGLAGVVSAVPDGRSSERTATIKSQFLALFYFAQRIHSVFASKLWDTELVARNPLSRRQQECLKWSASGKTSDEIAAIIGISTPTVEKHIREAIRRLDATSRIQAVAKAIQLRFITL